MEREKAIADDRGEQYGTVPPIFIMNKSQAARKREPYTLDNESQLQSMIPVH